MARPASIPIRHDRGVAPGAGGLRHSFALGSAANRLGATDGGLFPSRGDSRTAGQCVGSSSACFAVAVGWRGAAG